MAELPSYLEQVEFRDLQITLFQSEGAYYISVDRWQDNQWQRVNMPIQARNSDGSIPTLNNGLCRKLWDIYGKRMEIES